MAGERTRVVAFSGGVGGAKLALGLSRVLPAGELMVVANTGDDFEHLDLAISPDIDTLTYVLAGLDDTERGWGRRDETWSVKTELAAYGVEPTWFGLGDRDIATHLVRTQMLDAGFPLSQVTEALCRRWLTPVLGRRVRLLPMTDDRVETHVAVRDEEAPSGRRVVHFQEYWVRLRAEVPAEAVLVVGLEDAAPGPGVIDAITDADLVLLPPSNPVVSVGTILGVPRVREALVATRAPVVGVSPIIGGSHVRGMANQLLATVGVEVTAGAVGRHYGARHQGGVLDGWLVDESDADQLPALHEAGLAAAAVPLFMTDPDATAAMAAAAISLVS